MVKLPFWAKKTTVPGNFLWCWISSSAGEKKSNKQINMYIIDVEQKTCRVRFLAPQSHNALLSLPRPLLD